MALGEFQLFQWKSRATQQREQEEYEKWAFPHGKTQQDNLQALLLAVFPKESIPTTLIPFLTCKELYESALKKSGGREQAVDLLLNTQKKYKRIIKAKDMPLYLAIVLADGDIDESCEYPAAEDIRAHAQALGKLRKEN
ncbi:MAG: hypothetical protein LBH28_12025 [Oscillospiraceae bacterium]|jgi:hypothetical protein|nr:hypothetical protein [Oscillospiraceae bacterium]